VSLSPPPIIFGGAIKYKQPKLMMHAARAS
jgi:hypothetical protein